LTTIPPDKLVRVPAHVYDLWPAWRSTQLKIAATKSISHAMRPNAETPALLFGRAFHTLTLEGEAVFGREYAVEPAWNTDGRTKRGKVVRREWLQHEARGRAVLDAETGAAVARLRDCVLSHRWIGPRILEARARDNVEQSVWWSTDGIEQKARLDAHVDDGQTTVIDLKSAVDASPRAFRFAARRLLYHLSAAHYCAGVYTTLGPVRFVLVAVEKDAVSADGVACYQLTRGALEKGEELRQGVLERIRDSIEARWRGEAVDLGYPSEPAPLDL